MNERICMSPPDVGELEEEFVLAAIRSGWVAPLGPDVDAVEQEFGERPIHPKTTHAKVTSVSSEHLDKVRWDVRCRVETQSNAPFTAAGIDAVS